ncbi:MAG: DUF547 domain-containing protein [Acidobacteria bacterium]|nr:DUF547 domain-containing protein [Acidobacteriota bacterium]
MRAVPSAFRNAWSLAWRYGLLPVTGVALGLGLALAAPIAVGAQDPAPVEVDALHRPFDEVLDIYVRDGFVYYNALRGERARLDRYVATLGEVAGVDAWEAPRRLAFWVNAYNAFVLQTIIDRYPIRGKAPQYPTDSIRQISGAFERRQFRAAGRHVTLDQIEHEHVAPLGDARALLALGRGAQGGGRLRSEAYASSRIEAQLAAAAREVVEHRGLVHVDAGAGLLSVTPLFSWREAAFVRTFAEHADGRFASRSPLERAVLALVLPHAVRGEAEFLRQNSFRMQFHDFDWRLNDLATR